MRPTRHHAAATNSSAPSARSARSAALRLPALAALVALALKLSALRRLLGTPLAELREADAEAYWRWSGALLESGGRGDAPFFLGPLYPYTLALVRALAGHSVALVLALQCVAGALAIGLLTFAAERLAGRAVALTVGLLLAANASWTFFDLLVLSESLQLALGSALLAVMVSWRWEERPRAGAALAGALVGLLALARPSSALLLLPLVALFAARAPRRAFGGTVLAAALAIAACAAPATWHHARVSGEFVPWTYSGGFNLFVGHGPWANGTWSMPALKASSFAGAAHDAPSRAGDYAEAVVRATGREPSPREHSDYFADMAFSSMRAEPGRALSLTARKLLLAFHHRELPQIESREAYEHLLGPLGVPGLGSFALLAVLGLAGFACAWRTDVPSRAILGIALVHVAAMCAFFVTDRYRVHLVPPLALGAAFSLRALADLARRRRVPLLRLATGAAIGALLTFAPAYPYARTRTAWDAAVTSGDAYLRAGDPARALTAYDDAVAIDRREGDAGDRSAMRRKIRAALYASRAIALVELRRTADAAAELERAVAIDPSDGELAFWLADLHALGGRHDEAARALALAGLPRERWAVHFEALAVARAAEGRSEEAAAFRRAAGVFAARDTVPDRAAPRR
ncbi:MAG: glycosyltransferase family 39 protein [Candidatus Eisenbacteria bacterium]|uniref:Glycosyltransferase family 39 protein n=1 Tax=Eiseniibacteriota bacterium TaxID=2212470 RepID=A0A933SAP7_UNCEI|nr:glycosyltransferase family 39 protein [Candidatus Eisenbacteria bacterium]